jgi:hypothetical protein
LFAQNYYDYFKLIYGHLLADGQNYRVLIASYFMRNAPGDLPITSRGGRLMFSQFQDCQYYEGDLDYFSGTGNPFYALGSPQKPNSFDVSYLQAVDPNFAKDGPQRCSMSDVMVNRAPQCSARVIIASRCGANEVPIVIQQLTGATSRAAGASRPSQADPAKPPALEKPAALTAADIRRDILGKILNHAGKMDITFNPDGTYASGDGRIGRNGKYQLAGDGRICWQDNLGFDGCFQYFRENGVLKVKRNDPKSQDLIGAVKVINR